MPQHDRATASLGAGHVLRVDIAEGARDFAVAVLDLGLPALDRAGLAYETVLVRMLGRFLAAAERDGDTIKCFIQDDDGVRQHGGTCRPLAADQLDGRFRSERDELKRRLEGFQPATSTERVVHRAVSEAFERLTAGADRGHAASSFFSYRDASGSQRLVWCWGYRPVESDPRPPALCPRPACRLLYLLRPGQSRKCPRCRQGRAGRSAGWWKALAAMLLVMLLAAGVGVWWYGRPTAVLTGEVTEAAGGRAVAGATVAVQASARQTVTAADGRFRLDRLPDGPTEIVVRAPGFREHRAQPTLHRAREAAVRVSLSGAGVLTGEVVDAADHSPVANADVRLAGAPATRRTGADGRFRLEGVRSGPATVEVQAAGYRAQKLEKELAFGTETPLRVALVGDATIAGEVVVAPGNQPVPDAKVRLSGTPRVAATDANGRFGMDRVRSGPARIEVTAQGLDPAAVSYDLAAGRETLVRVALAGALELTVAVVDAKTEQPVAADVKIVGMGRSGRATADGPCRFEAMRKGPVEIEVAAPGYAPQRIARVLNTAEDATVRVRLKGEATLAGRVLDAASQAPVPDAHVTAGQPAFRATTDAQGRFSIDGLLGGQIEVQVAAAGYVPWRRTEELGPAQQTSVVVELKREPPPVAETPAMPAPEKPPAVVATKTAPPQQAKKEVTFFGIKSEAGSVGFAVDCSGSMAGSRIERTKAELAESIVALDPQQTFYLSFFQSGPIPMSGEPRAPVPASPLEKVRAVGWMKGIPADDGTQPESTVRMLAAMKPRVIYLLSDGEFPELSGETFQVLLANRIAVNTVAFEDESGAQRLREIAEKTGGTYRFVPPAALPPHHRLLADTRLALLLIDALDDPPPNDTQALRKALVELCDHQDFGPQPNAAPPDVARAADAWTQWWVEKRLFPAFVHLSEAELRKELREPQAVLRWGDLVTARRGDQWWEQKRQDWQTREREREAERKRQELEARRQAMERRAQQRLEMALQLRRGFQDLGTLGSPENRQRVRERLAEVIQEFPGTPAAKEAQRELDAMK